MQTECKACRGSGQVVCRACFKGDPWDLDAVRERAGVSPTSRTVCSMDAGPRGKKVG